MEIPNSINTYPTQNAMRTVGGKVEMVRLFPSGSVVVGVDLLEVTD